MTVALRLALFVRTFSPYGGVEKSCYEFYQYLRERGVAVTVFCGRNETGEAGPHIRIIPLWRPGRFLKTLSFYWGAGMAVRALPPDVASLSYATVAGCTAFRSGGAHLDFVTGTLEGYPTRAARWWKAVRRAANPINWLQPALDRAIYTHPGTKRIIAISGLVAEEVIRRFGLDPARVAVVENGVDTARFNREAARARREEARAALGLLPGRVGVGFCSTNFELKGLAPLIEALAELPERFELLVAGKRDPAKYARLAQGLGLGGRVRFLGKVTDMPGFYAGIDVLCHPSFYDTFGNVVAEALAMGRPVVTTSRVGARDLIQPGENGFLADPLDRASLAGAVERAAGLGLDVPARVADNREVFARYLEILSGGTEEADSRG
jgi:UDP-glucose:(heptosyl)LPS alpha-1,3-glucosyltransferase